MSANARKNQRIRTALLISIAMTVVATVALQWRMRVRREEAAQAAADRPEARARDALQDADRAAINGDSAAVERALERARGALDEALAEQPDEDQLLRVRVSVARRLAHLARQGQRVAEARPLLEDAVARAARLHDESPTDTRARAERMAAARELADLLATGGEEGRGAEVAEGAAQAVEASLGDLGAGPQVLDALIDTWLDAARMHAAAKAPAAALAAAGRAVGHAEAALKGASDAVGAAGRLYGVLLAAMEAADAAERKDEAERLERRALEVVELRDRLTPDEVAVRRAMGTHCARLADRAAAGGREDEARRLLDRALEVRTGLAARLPGDAEAQQDLVRTLNSLGALHSAAGRHEEALEAYRATVEAAARVGREGRRMRLIALGNYAHLLGRLDRMVDSKKTAAEAYALAVELADEARDDPQAAVDAAVAGLRHARLLRAQPAPDRKSARAVAAEERQRLQRFAGETSARARSAREGLDALIKELGS